MIWRYMPSRDSENGVDVWGIREVYDTGGWTESTVDPIGNTFGELKHDLEMMSADMGRGVFLDLTLDPPQIVGLTHSL